MPLTLRIKQFIIIWFNKNFLNIHKLTITKSSIHCLTTLIPSPFNDKVTQSLSQECLSRSPKHYPMFFPDDSSIKPLSSGEVGLPITSELSLLICRCWGPDPGLPWPAVRHSQYRLPLTTNTYFGYDQSSQVQVHNMNQVILNNSELITDLIQCTIMCSIYSAFLTGSSTIAE